MRQKTFRTKLGILAIAAGALLSGMFFVFAFSSPAALAFVGPGQAPPNGSGAIGSDSSNNVSIGTPTTISGTKLLVVGASSDNTTYGEQILENNSTPVFILRDDGSVSIETSTISAGNTIVGGNLTVGGVLSGSAFSGTVNASLVTSGAFPGGNYTFPSNVYFPGSGIWNSSGNVGIGTTSPTTALTVVGDVSSTGICLSGVCNTTWPNNSQWTSAGTAIYYNGGNVGIGTTTPTNPLEVYIPVGAPYPTFGASLVLQTAQNQDNSIDIQNTSALWQFSVRNGGDANPGGFNFYNTINGGSTWTNVINMATGGNVSIPSGTLTVSGTGNSSIAGNVGIGTTAPGATLDVVGSQMQLSNPSGSGSTASNYSFLNTTANSINTQTLTLGTTYGYGTPVNAESFFDGGVSVGSYAGTAIAGYGNLIVSGNVGIGTTAPAYTLDVAGTGNFTGVVNVGTPTAASNAATKSYVDSAVSSGVNGGVNGTANYFPIFTGTNTIGNSVVYQSGGNVGIGTTAPLQLLNVNGASGSPATSGTTQGGTFALSNSNSYSTLYEGNYTASPYAQWIQSSGRNDLSVNYPIVLQPNGGNVGIGTTNPTSKLQVAGNTWIIGTASIGQNTNGTAVIDAYGGNSYYGNNSATNGITINSSGNVGIGTAAPAYTLDVAGTGNFTGVVNVGTPTAAANAATKSYVDSAVSSGVNGGVNGTTGYDAKFTGTNTVGNGNIFESGSNVGIGTTAPGQELTVVDAGNLNMYQGTANFYPNNLSQGVGIGYAGISEIGSNGNNSLHINSQTGGNLLLEDQVSGNVGIGTTAPAYNLDVAGTGNFTGVVNVGTPTAASNAATKSYVDSAVSSGVNGGVNGTANYVPIFTGTNTIGNSVVYQSGGNVGIGTTGPVSLLTLSGDTANTLGLDIEAAGWPYVNRLGVVGTSGDDLWISQNYNQNAGTIDSSLYGTDYIRENTSGSFISFGTAAANTAPSERMRITNTGNVGIGTTAPAYNLDVAGTGNFTGVVNVGTPTAASNAATKSYVDSAVSSGVNGGVNGTANYVPIFTGTNTIGNSVVYQSGGNVGIGTTAPTYQFQIANGTVGSTVARIGSIDYGSSGAVLSVAPGNVYFDASGVVGGHMTILDNGNVGIGTTTPAAQLDIYGIGSNYISPSIWGATHATMNAVNPGEPCSGCTFAGADFASNGTAGGYPSWNIGLETTAVNSSEGNMGLAIYGVAAGANNYALYSNSAAQSYFAGNVGIGTTAPAYTLDVAGTGNFTGVVNVGTPVAASNAATKSYVDSAVASGVSGGVNGTTNYVSKFTGANTIGNSIIYDNGTGVGIGTTAPNGILDVERTNDSGVILALGNGAVDFQFSRSAVTGALSIQGLQTGYNNIVLAPTGGNVGIGTATPGSTLTVNGTANVGNSLTVGAGETIYDGSKSGIQTPLVLSTNEGSNQMQLLFQQGGSSYHSIQSVDQGVAYTNLALQPNGGNVGIGTAAPAYTLDVNGVGNFNSNVIHNVGTPVTGSDAANKSYVDTVFGGGGSNGDFATLTVAGTATIDGQLVMSPSSSGINMNGTNILSAGTLQVTTIDPSYQIGGTNYETFAPSIAGVQDEVTGNGTLVKSGSDYEYAINFPKLTQGSDLWVWYQTVDFSKDTVEAIATPYGQFAEIYYTISGSTLTFHGNAPAQFSFRLTGKRFDWQKWPTQSANQSEKPGFVLPVKD